MISRQFKHRFDMLFRQMKCTVFVHKNYGPTEQSTTEYQGLKNSEKNKAPKVMFQFATRIDVKVGDIIQQKNAHDLWEVYETEDKVIGDEFIYFRPTLTKSVRRNLTN